MELLLIGVFLLFCSFAYFLAAGGFLLGFLGSLWASSRCLTPLRFFGVTLPRFFEFLIILFLVYPIFDPPLGILFLTTFSFLNFICYFREFWIRHTVVVAICSLWSFTIISIVNAVAGFFWKDYVPYNETMKLHVIIGFFIGTVLGRLYSASYYDRSEYTGERNWKWWRSLKTWEIIHNRFSFSIDYEDEKGFYEEGGAMIGVHPHGLWNTAGPYCAGLHSGKVKIDFLMGLHWWLFWIPIVRDFCLWAGNINPNWEVLEECVKEGKKIGLCPGGLEEMMLSNVNELDLYFGHEGFLRIAWKQKVPAVPIFSEGENRIWLCWNKWPELRRWCKKMIGYPYPIFFIPWPWKVNLKMHVGKPIRPEECDEYEVFKKAYYAELFSLINKHETDFPLAEHLKEEIKKILG